MYNSKLPFSGLQLQNVFKVPSGWLDSFKASYNVVEIKCRVESKEVIEHMVTEWKQKSHILILHCGSKNIFSAEETRLIFHGLLTVT